MSADGEATLTAIRLFIGLVTVAAVVGLAVRRIALPFSVALVVIGLVTGTLVPESAFTITPELVLAVLLPGLVFEASYNLDLSVLRRTFAGIALLAVPGVVISAAVVAFVLNVGTGLSLGLGFVVGAMVAATDPIAVIATFRQVGAPRHLATLVEGESLFNDGTGLVVFGIAVQAVASPVAPVDALLTFATAVAVSAVLGAAVGYLSAWLIASVDDHLLELTISLAAAYGSYLVADAFHQSGVIATVVTGVVLGNVGRQRGMSARTIDALDEVWGFVAYLLTALAFLLVGMTIQLPGLEVAVPSIAWAIAGILVSRAILVHGLLGITSAVAARRSGARIPVAWLHILFWSGLRGAVATAMALSLPISFPERTLLQSITFGVVLYTLLVQGTTIGMLVRKLGVGVADGAEFDAE